MAARLPSAWGRLFSREGDETRVVEVAAEVTEVLSSHYGLRSERLIPLPGGFIHRVWRSDTTSGPRFVKLYRGEDWKPKSVLPTLNTQAYAFAAGHPVPKMYRTLGGDLLAPVADGWIAVSDFAEGRQLGSAELTDQAAANAGTVLGRLHRTLAVLPTGEATPFIPDTDGIRDRSRRLLANAQARETPDELDLVAIAAARYRLDAMERHPVDPLLYVGRAYQVVHGDFYPGNLLFVSGGILSAILDWDFCGGNWRGIEVARAVVETALTPDDQLDWQRATAFLDAYTAQQPLSTEERRSMFQLWFNYLLFSVYPFPLRYQPGAVLPEEWEELGRRRHRMLLVLGQYLLDLEEWAVGSARV